MDNIEIMAAKSSSSDKSKWLSFTAHSEDTADMICRIYDKWLSLKERRYIAVQLDNKSDIDTAVSNARNYCRLIALLHDIGKLTPAFQSKITDNITGHRELLLKYGFDLDRINNQQKTPHNAAGYAILEELGFPSELAIIVGAHHGKCSEDDLESSCHLENYYGYKSAQKREWHILWEKWSGYALSECGYSSANELPIPNVRLQMILTALLVMSDWLASNTDNFPLTDVFCKPTDRKERLYTAWKNIGLPLSWQADNTYNTNEMFSERFGFCANTVQREVMDTVSNCISPGIYILEAPMGLGKTEAALAASEILAGKYQCGGIYFGLPTQATANGIFSRIKSWAEQQCDGEKHTIRLAHGMTELNDEYQKLFRGKANDIDSNDDMIVHEWFEGGKQALLADFVIGTVDQFLLTSLKQKHVMLRHLGLAGKVVIIDECHAYDAYMNVYLDRTLKWMGAYEVPVIILSATLPPQRRKELVKAYLNTKKNIEIRSDPNAYPVFTWTDGEQVCEKALGDTAADKHISIDHFDESALAQKLKERLYDGGCAAVIVNTVKKAQQLAKDLTDRLADYEIMCFHSRFTATDRTDIERTLLKRVGKDSNPSDRNRLIVVGTQVIEQSLDIDFDYMVTELCPMDLLLQRSGRLHRHNRDARPSALKKPVLSILQTDGRGSESIYGKWLLEQTEKYLPEELHIPSCIPELVGKVYAPAEETSGAWEEHCRKISDKRTKADKYCINSDKLKGKYTSLDSLLDDDVGGSRQAEASVRDGEETIEVLLMICGEEGDFRFLPWRNGGSGVSTLSSLSDSEAIAIARERIRLPAFYSKTYNWNRTIDELNAMPERWRDNVLLNRELLLLLDENLECELLGRKLRYSKEYGLEEITENEG